MTENEPYVPSEKEIKSGEEQQTVKQRIMSAENSEALKAALDAGNKLEDLMDLKIIARGAEGCALIIDGHSLELDFNDGLEVLVSVDDIKIEDRDRAVALFKKYGPVTSLLIGHMGMFDVHARTDILISPELQVEVANEERIIADNAYQNAIATADQLLSK